MPYVLRARFGTPCCIAGTSGVGLRSLLCAPISSRFMTERAQQGALSLRYGMSPGF